MFIKLLLPETDFPHLMYIPLTFAFFNKKLTISKKPVQRTIYTDFVF